MSQWPALAWYTASVGNNYATPTLLQCLHGRPLPLNVLEQATMMFIGIASCQGAGVPLPGPNVLALGVLCWGVYWQCSGSALEVLSMGVLWQCSGSASESSENVVRSISIERF